MISLSQRFRESYRSVLDSALDAVNPAILITKHVSIHNNTLKIREHYFDLSEFEKIYMIGIGKGAPGLYKGLMEILGENISKGIIISGENFKPDSEKIFSFKGDHPVPGENSLRAAEELKDFVSNINKKDLVITLVTGGSSSMIVSPPAGIGINDISGINHLLIRSGASIQEINCIRKHLSTIKGGLLAKMICPAKIISLIMSDVPGSDPGVIGSGPFYGDMSTFQDAVDILNKYSLIQKVSKTISEYLKKGAAGDIVDTPEPDDPILSKNITFVIGENIIALNAAKARAEELGFRSEIVRSDETGDVRSAAKRYGELIRKRLKNCKTTEGGLLLLAGGEFTIKVSGSGKGGRIQEFLLLLLPELKEISTPYLIAGAGTDGRDGITDAAGAWIDENTFRSSGTDPNDIISGYLKNNDSYNYFKKSDQLIFTGPTGTNVMDIFLFFIS